MDDYVHSDSTHTVQPSTTMPSTKQGEKTDAWTAFRAGFLATMPLWLGAAPFGAIYAVTALAAGLSGWQVQTMSLLVFAGSAQFTAAGLFASGASALSIVTTTAILNARHLLLAASLTPYTRLVPGWIKALLATQLTDETYAVGMRAFLDGRGSLAYFFGSNISMYLVWQCSTAVGLALGTLIPDPAAYGLDLIFPLTFIALLMPLLREHANRIVATLAAVLAVVGALVLPGSWYILIAGIVASGIGLIVQKANMQ